MEKLVKEELERVAQLSENEVGFKEENVKFKVIIPILELLGHKKESLDLEYGTKEGKEIDIFIKGLPRDCKLLIDAKNYTEEEKIGEEYTGRIEGIDADIEAKEEEIEQLKKDRETLAKKMEEKKSEIWNSIGLPLETFRIPQTTTYVRTVSLGVDQEHTRKAGRVTFQELIEAGLIKNGQTLYFYNTRLFKDEQAQIIAPSNKLKYKNDGRIYSTSELAKILLTKHGFKRDEHGVAGPKYWKTEDGKLLNDINEQLRRQRGDRK